MSLPKEGYTQNSHESSHDCMIPTQDPTDSP